MRSGEQASTILQATDMQAGRGSRMRPGAYQYRCRGGRRQTSPAGWGGGGGGAFGMALLASRVRVV